MLSCGQPNRLDLEVLKMHERQTLTIEEAARRLGIGRSLAYEMARRGEIPARRLGRRFLVPVAALEAWLSEREVAA